MDDLTDVLANADRALAMLKELSVLISPTVVERDATMKRFDYTLDTSPACEENHQ